jgi:transposase
MDWSAGLIPFIFEETRFRNKADGVLRTAHAEIPKTCLVERVFSSVGAAMPRGTKIWAGLDIGVETTSICVIDNEGNVLQQAECPTRIECIHNELRWLRRRRAARIAMEASSTFSLARGLQSLGYKVDIYETLQLSKFLRVRRNKTDVGDAIGIAEAGRLGGAILSKVFLKSYECQALQSRLTVRRHLLQYRIANTNLLCRQIEQYGGRVAGVRKTQKSRKRLEAEMLKVFGKARTPLTMALHQLGDRSQQLIDLQAEIDSELTRTAFENDVCRRFMEIPGVGPMCALAFYAAVGDPHRFTRSADIGPYFGLTPKVHQSGLTSRAGKITRMGNSAVRSLLTRSSLVIMRANAADSELRRWALRIEARRGRGRARVALARKLAVIMIAMWKKGQSFTAQPYQDEPSPPLESAEAPTPFIPVRVKARADCWGGLNGQALAAEGAGGGEPACEGANGSELAPADGGV